MATIRVSNIEAKALNSDKTLSGSINGGVFGPYEIASGVTLTISSGATFTVL